VSTNNILLNPFYQINSLGYALPSTLKDRDLTEMTSILIQSKSKKLFIDHLKDLCNFPNDSTMLKYIEQQGWLML
jgi:hypothetical protein